MSSGKWTILFQDLNNKNMKCKNQKYSSSFLPWLLFPKSGILILKRRRHQWLDIQLIWGKKIGKGNNIFWAKNRCYIFRIFVFIKWSLWVINFFPYQLHWEMAMSILGRKAHRIKGSCLVHIEDAPPTCLPASAQWWEVISDWVRGSVIMRGPACYLPNGPDVTINTEFVQ